MSVKVRVRNTVTPLAGCCPSRMPTHVPTHVYTYPDDISIDIVYVHDRYTFMHAQRTCVCIEQVLQAAGDVQFSFQQSIY
jgi:hypothetical protein